ncbi:hypothetical protein COW36_18985 [bacterium (Candidatus Blackallbacteria) CG17_big_fil_post_rev_8_21_14_2_50_48_46]|uniref:Uncharacterized protein n=1 Tax=bacterium (Candidatus Blackallbacteria) CG17_big_fil_post_rev_8_21_14_2_50_48_46 TaxID=2014261 RepID=A0A2M7G001_9BACT|nr:MAG: hypothetical protein COW64_25485 [bacterium (Candidatus Blackallbacteria) CG18_big_fil_WC_8_21_14_2_50_49_26]PIW15013.1 MAG: hypothetical protein COW36_18985 [bacterium (Candidatus Blackallbacteria) CG17_big_fil_post_rev_8_21_14_2_50_48_46]PIW50094.1 MAG: hypothetical protein COW20_03920 [bacterium (Candidatus Blackallbacteria) CG13_big_fil_rev_8_21_14_2_50_49_14]
MSVHCFGIRHHGPGSARSLRKALAHLQPDLLLIEGPPEADGLIDLTARGMVPPVALLLYDPAHPAQAVYYPFARFSPEWQALQYAHEQQIPARFCDLPQAHYWQEGPPFSQGMDPISLIAQAAGYPDGESWWEETVEQRQEPGEIFEALAELIQALRAEIPDQENPLEARREAQMRQSIRKAEKEGFTRIAVVCGAWHVPALLQRGPAKSDQALLKGLPKHKLMATWIPWTHSRLCWQSGYGAGIESPGWYDHLWSEPDQWTIRWLVKVAQVLRRKGQDVSSAHLIEATRLAETLASLRDKPLPGLEELNEAIQAVMTQGRETPLLLIHNELVVDQRLGQVPPETPMLPLEQDLLQMQKKLRLKPEAEQRLLELDLRKPQDQEKSRLLYALNLLNLPWGHKHSVQQKGSTFHENWTLQWQPEFQLALIEAAPWGNTVFVAAEAFTIAEASKAQTLPELTLRLADTLLAELPSALSALLSAIQAQTTACTDLNPLLSAFPELAKTLRYGNVRQTDWGLLFPLVEGILIKICAGLPAFAQGQAEESQREMINQISAVDRALQGLEPSDWQNLWRESLEKLSSQPELLGGYVHKLCFESGHFSLERLEESLSQTLSLGKDPAQASLWLEGFLQGSGLLLLHHPSLLQTLDGWILTLQEAQFIQFLPLLRRSFSQFQRSEREQLARQIKSQTGGLPIQNKQYEPSEIEAFFPIYRQLLGMEIPV